MKRWPSALALTALLLAAGCGSPWNNPYPAAQTGANILYSSFSERPKHLDPTQAYSENEYAFIAQIYQPPLQYHYLKRPYELIPLAAAAVPQPRFTDAQGRTLPAGAPASRVAYSVYEIRLRPGQRYQPHPAFATDAAGKPLYLALSARDLEGVHELRDFAVTGTRELEAADYVHQIKRLAHPRLHSPIYALMSEYIVGLKELAAELKAADTAQGGTGYLDLERFALKGVEVVDRHTFRVTVRGRYPQFVYWLAMPFFAPVPPEADRFYSQPGMAERNITLDWYPVGTGAYMLTVNNPNRQMILERNPNFGGERYPGEGEPGDAAAGRLADAGRALPFIDKVVFSLEKEQIPYWNKFLQGYYDASGIASDTFDQAVQFTGPGDLTISDAMRARGIELQTSVATSLFYMGFNWLDPVVGGSEERARKLRQAISIAIDQEEFIAIFRNGRGLPAMGPIPPGIFGYRDGREGVNPYVYEWTDGGPRRRALEEARRLLAEAGYPGGRDARTGQQLLINLDTTSTGAEGKARLDWFAKQFDKLGIQLAVRTTDFNRLQEKLRKGNTQLFFLGWNADYPDPENFLFLLYGPQGKVKTQGENAANYANPEFDRLFEQMKHMDNGPERAAIIDRMLEIVRRDAPWVFMLYPKDFSLQHGWLANRKPNQMANNGLKYQRIDVALRERRRQEWNHPVLWPALLAFGALVLALVPAAVAYRRRERAGARLEIPDRGGGGP